MLLPGSCPGARADVPPTYLQNSGTPQGPLGSLLEETCGDEHLAFAVLFLHRASSPQLLEVPSAKIIGMRPPGRSTGEAQAHRDQAFLVCVQRALASPLCPWEGVLAKVTPEQTVPRKAGV